ncbi:MAG: hypothetical protein ACJAQ6_000278 [Arenicella sp.]|jgi:hypothetical protein
MQRTQRLWFKSLLLQIANLRLTRKIITNAYSAFLALLCFSISSQAFENSNNQLGSSMSSQPVPASVKGSFEVSMPPQQDSGTPAGRMLINK